MVTVALGESGPHGPASGEETAFFVLSEEATWVPLGSSSQCVDLFPAPLARVLRWGMDLGKCCGEAKECR